MDTKAGPTESGEKKKTAKTRQRTVRVSAQDIEIYRLVTEEGMAHGAVAEQFDIHEATVGRTVKRVREYLRELREFHIATGGNMRTDVDEDDDSDGSPPGTVSVAVTDQRAGRDSVQIIPGPGENILDQVTDFAKISQASAATGVVVGCALSSIADGLTNPELSDVEGLRKTATGFASLGGFLFGSLKTFQRLQGQQDQKKPPREI